MATLKKNQVNQILFTMVDKTDFATIETSLASNFTVKTVGVNHGSAAATISTLSRIVSKVGSGVYRLSLEANMCNYDYMFVRIAHASAATQMLAFQMATADDTDLYSQLQICSSKISGISDILSAVYVDTADISNILSKTNSRVGSTLISKISGISDILSKVYVQTTSMLSQTSDLQSNFNSFVGNWGSYASDVASAVWAHAAGASVVNRVSQIKAYAIGASNILSAVYVDTADISNILSGMSGILSAVYVDTADISNIVSNIKVQADKLSGISNILSAVYVDTTDISDILSKVYVQTTVAASGASLVPGISDILSKVYVQTTALGDPSDIASAVWAQKWDVHSTASTFGSALAKWIESGVNLRESDMSDLRSAIAAGPAATITDSDISNIASAVWGFKWDTNSVASSFGSAFEVILSQLSDTLSAATQINSRVLLAQSFASEAYSMALLNKSLISDVYSLVSDVQSAVAAAATASDVASKVWNFDPAGCSGTSTILSTLRSAIAAGPTATVTDSDISNIASAVWAFKYDTNSVASSFGSAFEKIYSHISGISDILSKVYVQTTVASSGASLLPGMSDILSKVYVQTTSMASQTSDTMSYLQTTLASKISGISDILSQVRVHVAVASSGASLIPGMSDILSKVYVQTTSMASQTSNANSKLVSFVGNFTSYISDIASRVWGEKWDVHSVASSFGSLMELMASRQSDIDSALTSSFSDFHSLLSTTMGGSDLYSKVVKLASRITVPVATQSKLGVVESHASLTYAQAASAASDVLLIKSRVSDIGSQVWAEAWDTASAAGSFGSAFEVLATNAAAAASRALLVQSRTSDIASQVWAADKGDNAAASSFGSKIFSAIAAGPAATITDSDVSNIASAVWGASISTLKGVAASFGSRYAKLTTSDALSKAQSSIESHVSGITATVSASAMSNIASKVWAEAWDTNSGAGSFGSAFEALMSNADSAASAAVAANSRILLVQSRVSDISSQVWAGDVSTLKTIAGSFGSRYAKLTTSDALSKAQSSIESHVSGITATVDNTSIASAVWAHAKATSTLAYTKVAASGASLVPGMSDILSKVYVQTTSMASQTSNANSYLVTTLSSKISGISDILSKTYALASDVDSKLGAASWLSDLASRTADAVWDTKYTAHSAASTFGSIISDIFSAAFAGALTSDAMSDIGVAVWTNASGVKVRSRVSDIYSMASDILSNLTAGVDINASGLSDIKSVVNAALDDAYTDATVITANGMKERLRALGWVIRNKLVVDDATGNAILYKDDGTTEATSVAAQFTDTGTTTTRKRYA